MMRDTKAQILERMERHGVPVLDYDPGSPIRNTYPIDQPPCSDPADDAPKPWALLLFVICASLVATILIITWIAWVGQHWQQILDFIAPTAAQAREAGWVALSEGRLR